MDLLITFWEDHYQRNSLESKRREDGEIMFETGDPLIDKWERELAMGIQPDLFEGLPKKSRQEHEINMKAQRETMQRIPDIEANFDGFSEDYSQKAQLSSLSILGKR